MLSVEPKVLINAMNAAVVARERSVFPNNIYVLHLDNKHACERGLFYKHVVAAKNKKEAREIACNEKFYEDGDKDKRWLRSRDSSCECIGKTGISPGVISSELVD